MCRLHNPYSSIMGIEESLVDFFKLLFCTDFGVPKKGVRLNSDKHLWGSHQNEYISPVLSFLLKHFIEERKYTSGPRELSSISDSLC